MIYIATKAADVNVQDRPSVTRTGCRITSMQRYVLVQFIYGALETEYLPHECNIYNIAGSGPTEDLIML